MRSSTAPFYMIKPYHRWRTRTSAMVAKSATTLLRERGVVDLAVPCAVGGDGNAGTAREAPCNEVAWAK